MDTPRTYQIAIDYPHLGKARRQGSCYTLDGTLRELIAAVTGMLRARHMGAVAEIYTLAITGRIRLLRYARLQRDEEDVRIVFLASAGEDVEHEPLEAVS